MPKQEHNSQNCRNANGQSISRVAFIHPECNPAEHDEKRTRCVDLQQVISQTSLELKCDRQNREIPFRKKTTEHVITKLFGNTLLPIYCMSLLYSLRQLSIRLLPQPR